MHVNGCDSDHPMCQFYSQQPNWSSIANILNEGTGKTNSEEVYEQFWDDKMFGGPLYYPINIFKDDGTTVDRTIGNNLVEKLEEEYS